MRLLGADGDHEAMTVEEVEARLLTWLRGDTSPFIHPTGSTTFIESNCGQRTGCVRSSYDDNGWLHAFVPYRWCVDKCIRVALEAGVDPIDAYQMASYNVARYYDMTDLHGMIATGRYATLISWKMNTIQYRQMSCPKEIG